MTAHLRSRIIGSTARCLVLAAALAATAFAQTPAPDPPAATGSDAANEEGAPSWRRMVERLMFNPRERTRRGLEQIERATPPPTLDEAAEAGADAAPPDDPAPAIAPFDAAARLAEDARTAYNAGTARLLAERQDATQLLETASAAEDPALASRAAFNLGNAHLAANDLQGAVDAYKSALRRRPDFQPAKHNLEIALDRLQQQQEQQQQNQDQQNQNQDQQNQDQQNQDQQNQDQQNQDQQNQDQQNQDQQNQDQQNQDQQN